MGKLSGYDQFCWDMDNLSELLKLCKNLNNRKLTKIFNQSNIITDNESENVHNKMVKDTSTFATKLMFALNIDKLTPQDMNRYLESKHYIYSIFFRPEYEPVIEELAR